MSRPVKIGLIAAASVAGLLIALIVVALIVIQTSWFRNEVRAKVASTVGQSTGGRAEIGAFSLSLPRMRAQLNDVVVHGTEGADKPPLLRAGSIAVTLNRGALLKGRFDIRSLVVEKPRVYVEVRPDGSTNIPSPRVKSTSGKNPVQELLDLAIGQVRIDNGLLVFADKRTPINLRGERLRVRFDYDASVPRYTGMISIAPAYVEANHGAPLPVNVRVALDIARNRIQVVRADLSAPESRVALAGGITNFAPLQGSLKIDGVLALREVARTANLQVAANYRQAPPVDISTMLALNGNELRLGGLNFDFGRTRFAAKGAITNLKALDGSFQFSGSLALGQLARVFRLRGDLQGTVGLAGEANLAGAKNYSVVATVDGTGIGFQAGGAQLRNVNARAVVHAKPQRIAFDDMRVSALGGALDGSAVLVRMSRFRVDAALHHFGIRRLARRYASRNLVWDGLVSGTVRATGDLHGAMKRGLMANANLAIVPGRNGIPLAGRIKVAYDGPRDTIDLGHSYLALPSTRLDLSGSIGSRLSIRLVSTNLADVLPAVALASANPPKSLPVRLVNGSARFDGAVVGRLANPEIAGRVALTNFVVENRKFDRFAADVGARDSGASVRNAALSRGSMLARIDGSIGLRNWKPAPPEPVSATFSLRNARMADLLAMAGRTNEPLSGTVTAGATVSGTVGDPRAALDVEVANGSLGDQPFNRLAAHLDYSSQRIALARAQLDAGQARVDLNAVYEHAPRQFEDGRLQFQVVTNTIQLGGLRAVQAREPSLSGTFEFRAGGAATLRPGPRFQLTSLNANVAARALQLANRRLGDLTATAATSGSDLTFQLQSDIANSDIRGNGTVALAGDYPLNANLTFSPVDVAAIRNLASGEAQGQPVQVGGLISGGLTVSGPAVRPQDMAGALRLNQVELTGVVKDRGASTRRAVALRNQGPVVVTLAQSVVRVQSARLVGSGTDFSLSGAMYLNRNNALDVRLGGDINLKLVESFVRHSFASGDLLLNVGVQGRLSQPRVEGRAQLRNASFNMLDVPNGLVNANGLILFNRDQLVIQDLNGETGGGKITVGGLVRYGASPMAFDLHATARGVHVLTRQGIGTKLDAKLTLGGTANNSLLAGAVTIDEVSFQTHTDFGSLLSGAGPPQAPQAQTGILGGMRLAVRIETSPAIQFITPLTQNLQANVRVQLLGTPSQPGMTGHVAVTQGDIVFFGAKYSIDRGAVNFFDPNRIEPVLNVDLQTKVQGIQVVLMVSGPMDNLKLTYRSDPPLQFSDIVRLLATGRVPTTDPVLAANQPAEPQQSWEQMGASALLGQAVANPVAGRLQRLFGVTQFKLEPKIVGVENKPQARMTLQQQVTSDLLFTYIQDVTQPNPQIIRIEWSFQPAWSVVAVRDEYGQFGLDFFYKKRFK